MALHDKSNEKVVYTALETAQKKIGKAAMYAQMMELTFEKELIFFAKSIE